MGRFLFNRCRRRAELESSSYQRALGGHLVGRHQRALAVWLVRRPSLAAAGSEGLLKGHLQSALLAPSFPRFAAGVVVLAHAQRAAPARGSTSRPWVEEPCRQHGSATKVETEVAQWYIAPR